MIWQGLATGALIVNKPRALVHIATKGVMLMTPGVFKAHSSIDWQKIQRRFLKLHRDRKNAEDNDFFTYWLGQGGPFKIILLPETSLLFAEAAPPPNLHLYPIE